MQDEHSWRSVMGASGLTVGATKRAGGRAGENWQLRGVLTQRGKVGNKVDESMDCPLDTTETQDRAAALSE